MYFQDTITALLGLSSLVAAVPTNVGRHASSELEERTLGAFGGGIVVNQFIQQTDLTIVNLNLDIIDDLTRLAEQQFALLIQSQLALAAQLQVVKNNIRLNHFKARFAQINTVIVIVQTVVDFREDGKINNRYMVNQLYADNGFADKQFVVMVSDIETLSIYPTPTASAGIKDIFGVGAEISAFPTFTPNMAAFDPAAPFGALNSSVLLPFGAPAPNLDVIINDPAAIIYPHSGFFVESPPTFFQSCNFYFAHANAFVDISASFFTSFTQIAAVQLRGLGSFFTAPTVVFPPAVQFNAEDIHEKADEKEVDKGKDKKEKKDEEKKDEEKKDEEKKDEDMKSKYEKRDEMYNVLVG